MARATAYQEKIYFSWFIHEQIVITGHSPCLFVSGGKNLRAGTGTVGCKKTGTVRIKLAHLYIFFIL
jgi:hypothetical protein